jgi:hypothetical protein
MRSVEKSAAAEPRLYIDTSAYLSMLLGEEGSESLREETAGAELMSSVLLILESKRNLVRLAREGVLSPAVYKACFDRIELDRGRFSLRDLTLDLCASNLLPAIATPRSLDLAHLRTALWFHGEQPLTRFVTTDSSQAHAARELGLPV